VEQRPSFFTQGLTSGTIWFRISEKEMRMKELNADTLYKFLSEDGTSPYAFFQWPLPNGKPTKWVRARGPLVVCDNGIHLCREKDLPHWLGPVLFEAEARGGRIDSANKIVVREARLLHHVETWNEKTARLFACDCAERAMRRVTALYGKQDKRSWNAIKAARQFAHGRISDAALSAAESAAWSAVRSVAWSAAELAARSAARSAAWSAAELAARSAARSAAWSAEREWQTQRLLQYLRGEIGE
jgi:sugar lactone lactonase YvrE